MSPRCCCMSYPRSPAHCGTEDSQAAITGSPAPSHTLQCLHMRAAPNLPVPGSCRPLLTARQGSFPGRQPGPCGMTAPNRASCSTGITQGGKLGSVGCPKAGAERSRLQAGVHSQVNLMPIYSQLDDGLQCKDGRTWRRKSMKTASPGLLLPG